MEGKPVSRDANDLRRDVESGRHDDMLATLYGVGAVKQQASRYAAAVTGFTEHFGPADNPAFFSSPGRTEIGGNHTDHQHGCVLAAGVTMDMIAVAAPTGDNHVRIKSEGFPEFNLTLDSLDPLAAERESSPGLVRGIAAAFASRGYTPKGFNAYVTSNVLVGSGLSSSASFEILIGVIFNAFFAEGKESAVEIAKIGKFAENIFFGKPSGLMDQMACSLGGVQFMDFGDPENPVIESVPFDLSAVGYVLCIIDSGADHADLSNVYAGIPKEMGEVAALFGRKFLAGLGKDELLQSYAKVRKAAGDRAALRALHFVNDNARARDEAAALREGRFADFLDLVNASGRSSFTHLQNILVPGADKHQEMAVALALCEEFLEDKGAFRVHGGGFAGTVQAFVPLDMLEKFTSGMESVLGQGRCHILSIRPKGGIKL